MDLDRKALTFVRASSAVINELATAEPDGPSWKRDDWRAEMTQAAYHVLVAARAVVAAAEAIIEQMKPPPPAEQHVHNHPPGPLGHLTPPGLARQ